MLPEDFAVRYDFGKALLQAHETDYAVHHLQAAIALNATHSGTHYQLALALKRPNRDDEAQREFALACELNKQQEPLKK